MINAQAPITREEGTDDEHRNSNHERGRTDDLKTEAYKEGKNSKGRRDTKKAIVLALLRRKEGATTAEIGKATDWQNHSIRGFISGTLGKKMGLNVESAKNDSGERTYRITA